VLLFVAILFICMIEDNALQINPYFSAFAIIFETISAYGTVGLSLGYGSASYSFSGAFSGGAKFIIILVMLLGKSRNLPNSIDSAVSLSNLNDGQTEDDDDVVEVMSESDEDPIGPEGGDQL